MVISVGIQISPNLNLPQDRYRFDRFSATVHSRSGAALDEHPIRETATNSTPAATVGYKLAISSNQAPVGRALARNSLGTSLEME